jgi:hypothetical protein
LGKDSRLHSTCVACHKDVVSFVQAVLVTGERNADCGNCGAATLQFRYESPRAQTYWLCASCGRESTRD